MNRLAVLVAMLVLTACGSIPIPVEQMKLTSSMLTVGGEGERFKRIPTTTFKQEDRIMYFANLTWPNIDVGAGHHDVVWTWLANGTPVNRIKQKPDFYQTPFEFWAQIPASALGVGKHRLEVTVDGKPFDSKDFEVVQ